MTSKLLDFWSNFWRSDHKALYVFDYALFVLLPILVMITAAMVRTIYPAVTSNGNFIIAVLGIIKGKVDIAHHGGK